MKKMIKKCITITVAPDTKTQYNVEVPKLRIDQYVSLLLLVFCCAIQPGLNPIQQITIPVVQASSSTSSSGEITPPDLHHHVIVPVYMGQIHPPGQEFDGISAAAVYVMDRESGAILYQKHGSDVRSPASTAKMMTALITRQLYPLDKVLTVREEAFTTGSAVHMQIGEQLTVEQLLSALLIPSGNDAALVFANNHPFGYQGFVQDMNQRAKELNLDTTDFKNPSGLDTAGEKTSARDLAILANEVMKDPVLRQIVGHRDATIHDVTGQITHQLTNTHELVGVVDGVVGIKTGTTESAGENLVTEVDRNGHQVIIVVLGSQNRFNETVQIINWIFANYQWQTVDH